MKYLCPKCKSRTLIKGSKTPGGKQRWFCRASAGGVMQTPCYNTVDPTAPYRDQAGRVKVGGRVKPLKFKRKLAGQRFLITSAQNATPVHAGFFAALLVAAKHLKAELVVIPIRFKNPTSRWTASQEGAEVWAEEVRPYLCNERKKLNGNLLLAADIKVQPSASRPLIGFESLSGSESMIVGHTKLQFMTVPAPANKMPKILTTTGACTLANNTDSRIGKQADFHHVLGATLVEVASSKKFHLRQALADKNGAFVDLDTLYAPDGVTKAPRAEALIFGDTHVDAIDPQVERAQFGPGGMVEVLRPKVLAYHDLLDGQSCNPHAAGQPFISVALRARGLDDVKAEVERAIKFVTDRAKRADVSLLVPSNHSDFLQRWLMTDWRTQPQNAEMYLETALAYVRAVKGTNVEPERFDAFGHWVRKVAGDRADICVLPRDDSFAVMGIELGQHGDKGANGTRGSRDNLKRIGVRTVIGHSHSPGVTEGAWQVGTSSKLRLGYNSGPSSWLQTSCVIYGATGKRCLLTVVDGDWKL